MTDIEQELLKLVQDLRAENAALLELILDDAGLLTKEVPSVAAATATGKLPWYIRQRNLTKLFKVHPTEVKEEDAG